MDAAPNLSLVPDYLARLIAKLRGLQAREVEVDPRPASNPIDDRVLDAVQDSAGDLTRQEIIAELQGLDHRQQAELVVLMWIGRGDEPEEWNVPSSLPTNRGIHPRRNTCCGIPLPPSTGRKARRDWALIS